MQSNKHPSWLVKRHLTKIRNRCVYFIQSKNRNLKRKSGYTWAECYHKAKSKIYYRFNNCDFENEEKENAWNNLIASIKARLVSHFDNEHGWRVTEYKVLEKINKQEFYKIESSSLIWHFVAVNKAGMANKLFKRKFKTRQRTDRYDWRDVVCNSKIRIINYAIVEKSEYDQLWDLAFLANLEKLRMRFRWIHSWNDCVNRNYNKLKSIS